MKLSNQQIHQFQETLWDYYSKHARKMPWRDTTDPYRILVSEVMLQQTQVSRVIPKYEAFIARFPDVKALATAPLGQVLTAWSGLGYNRRAKYLWQAAKQIQSENKGKFPQTLNALTNLPGVGKNTAGATLAYAYNKPALFIETNVRTVYIHHFFNDQFDISDSQILPLLEQTIDKENPRGWYWALMDYGSHLKRTQGNNITRSKHHTKQSKFQGSNRQIRGKVIKLLSETKLTLPQLQKEINDNRLNEVLSELQKEDLVIHRNGWYRLG